ncbi:hypothetical protein ACIBH1_45580 [Nonomuraea sp. NPDC050663]|uniref:hypothetical protein n=1 Tax=Nonomuraea sp. NPDC050663 TaxID=3364370 RepID=UPI0037A78C72
MSRQPAQAGRDARSARQVAATIEHLGRALAALDRGNWKSFRAHLHELAEESMRAVSAYNGDSFPGDHTAYRKAIGSAVPTEWVRILANHLDELVRESGPVADSRVAKTIYCHVTRREQQSSIRDGIHVCPACGTTDHLTVIPNTNQE